MSVPNFSLTTSGLVTGMFASRGTILYNAIYKSPIKPPPPPPPLPSYRPTSLVTKHYSSYTPLIYKHTTAQSLRAILYKHLHHINKNNGSLSQYFFCLPAKKWFTKLYMHGTHKRHLTEFELQLIIKSGIQLTGN